MLQGIRDKAIDNPKIFKIVMSLVAATFIFSLGWWGISGDSNPTYVAKVDGDVISVMEYQRAYRNSYEFYRNIFKEKFDENMVKQLDLKKSVLDNLINRKVWLGAAKDMGVTVSTDELKDDITSNQNFFENGKFSSTLYKNILAANRIKPKDYETAVMDDLYIKKAQKIVKSAVEVSETELNEAAGLQEGLAVEDKNRLMKDVVLRKQEEYAASFVEGMKKKVKIEIAKNMMS